MKKIMLILLLAIGMTLSFAAISLVMLFALNVVENMDEVRSLLIGEMPGAETTLFKEGEIEEVQDALLLLQQHKQEIEQDLEKLKEDQKVLEDKKNALSGEIGELEVKTQQGDQTAAQARAERLTQAVALYDAMRPADAATIMNGLPNDMILEILPRLKERQAASILNNLDEAKRQELAPLLVEGKTATRRGF